MTRLNICGFETGDYSELIATGGASPPTVQVASANHSRSGGYGLYLDVPYGFPVAGYVELGGHGTNGKPSALGRTAATYYRFYFKWAYFSGEATPIAGVYNTAGSVVASLNIDASGNLQLVGATTSSVIGNYTGGVPICVEMKIISNGACEARVNGGTVQTCTGNNITQDRLRLGYSYASMGGASLMWDDIAIDDAAYPGAGEVHVAVPTGNSAINTTWSASAGNKWDCIDELPPSAADYIESLTTAGDRLYSATHDTCATLGIIGTIAAVKTVAIMWEAASTSTLGAIGIRSNGANTVTTNVDIGTTAEVMMAQTWSGDPNNASAAWTATSVNAAEPIVKRATGTTPNIRCKWLGLMVESLGAVTVAQSDTENVNLKVTETETLELVLVKTDTDNLNLKFNPEVESYEVYIVPKTDADNLNLKLSETELVVVTPAEGQDLNLKVVESEKLEVQVSPVAIDNALQGLYGPVSYRFRFERRTVANQFLADVTAAFPTDLNSVIDGNNDRAIFRSGDLFIDPSASDINPLADHIAVICDLNVKQYVVPIQLGLFMLNVPLKTFSTTGKELWKVKASDITQHLVEATTTSVWTVAAGANYITGTNAVKDILDLFDIRSVMGSTTLTLSVAQSWPPGTPWLTIVNKLLSDINFYSAKPDSQGIMRSRPNQDNSLRPADVAYTDLTYLTGNLEEETDTTRFANQVVATRTDPAQALLVSVKTNTDPDSPISTVSLGRTITKMVEANGAPDQTTLDAIAVQALRDASDAYRKITIQTQFDPRRDAFEIYSLTDPGAGLVDDLWLVRQWKLSLKTSPPPGTMEHVMSKVGKMTPS